MVNMKHIKLFEGFKHKSTDDMTFNEIKKIKEELTKKGGFQIFQIYLGKAQSITSFLRSLSSLSSPWVERIDGTNVKVYDTPDEDSKHEIADMLDEFGFHKMDLNKLEETLMSEGHDVMVADMDVEAANLVDEIKDSLDFASAKLYDLKKMSDYIKSDYPKLSKDIATVVEPMMVQLETDYPKQLQELLKKFK